MADGVTNLLESRGVRACYESVEVLHGVDIRIEQGSVTAVLGPNGAGKSTLLSVLAGLHQPSAGEVLFDGKPVRTGTAHLLVRAGLCLIPEGKGIFPNLTVQENLWMMTHCGASRRQVEERAFARFPQLSSRRSQAAGTLSGGEQQMLAVARAVSTEPRLLLLDELSMGLAPIVVEDLYAVVAALAQEGVTVVVVEQFAQFALKVAHWAVVMTGGRVVHSGPASDTATYLADLYLGRQSDNGNALGSNATSEAVGCQYSDWTVK
jgi:branched-chain amino acid transport system ATP-binding protein